MAYEVLPLARRIASHLGPEWTARHDPAQPDCGYRTLVTGPGGKAFTLTDTDPYGYEAARGRTPRLSVTGCYPAKPTGPAPGITVSCGRPAHILARDIARRFLPAYRETLAQVHRAQAVKADRDARVRAVAARLADAAPNAYTEATGCIRVDLRHIGQQLTIARAHVAYVDQAVTLELPCLPPELAERILAACTAYHAEHAPAAAA
jgi:hypothetical protein